MIIMGVIALWVAVLLLARFMRYQRLTKYLESQWVVVHDDEREGGD